MDTQQRNWRIAFIVLSALTFIILPMLSPAYGQTGDEWLQIYYGRDIWDYFFYGDKQALGYDVLINPMYKGMERQFKGQELYGGLFDFGTEVLHHWFPSIPQLVLRHACNALTSALMMVSTGLIAFRLSKRWSVAVIALLFIFFSPRIFGEGMNNPKDIPFGAGFTLATYGLLALVQDGRRRMWWHAILLMLGFGLAFGVRSAGGLLFIAYAVVIVGGYYLLNKKEEGYWWGDKKLRIKALLFIIGALVGGYIIGLVAWPWGLESPISHPLESLQGMTNRETPVRTLFEGEFILNSEAPSNYEFKWMTISNPIAVIVGATLFLLFILRVAKVRGWFTVVFVFFAALFPLLYMMYKHSSVYDTWRHVFFVYPSWVVAAAIGWWMLGDFINARFFKNQSTLKEQFLWPAASLLVLLPAIIWTFRSHPNQYVYFNEFVGGIKGAAGNYETDYYYNSSQQAFNWILRNMPRTQGKKNIVLSNMGGISTNVWHNDTAYVTQDYNRFDPERLAAREWDYYVLFPRLLPDELIINQTWVPQNAVHVVKLDDVPLCAIMKKQ